MAIMNKLTAAYLAGFLDGEGCFSIWYRFNQPSVKFGGHGRVFQVVIRVGGTNKEIIEWLKNSFGGSFSTMSKVGNDFHRNQAYQWALYKKSTMQEFLSKIIPYMRVKKREAQVVYEFLQTYKKDNYERNQGVSGGVKMTKETFEKRIGLMHELFNLHQKGMQRKRLSEERALKSLSDSPTPLATRENS